MLGYNTKDIMEMAYGVESAMMLINADENPAIIRFLDNTKDLLAGLLAEGYIN